MRTIIVLAVAFVVCGCGGGTNPGSGGFNDVMEQVEPQFTAAQPAGTSATLTFRERRCHFSAPDLKGVGHPTGCDAWHVPNSLNAAVSPMSNGQPCTATVTVLGAGTLRVTKTGAGDPTDPDANGGHWCWIYVTDPTSYAVVQVHI